MNDDDLKYLEKYVLYDIEAFENVGTRYDKYIGRHSIKTKEEKEKEERKKKWEKEEKEKENSKIKEIEFYKDILIRKIEKTNILKKLYEYSDIDKINIKKDIYNININIVLSEMKTFEFSMSIMKEIESLQDKYSIVKIDYEVETICLIFQVKYEDLKDLQISSKSFNKYNL